LPSVAAIYKEIDEMTDVLLGREPPPINNGIMTLYEVANAYYARAAEITQKLQKHEAQGQVIKGSAHYKLRTGSLRTFMELAAKTAELGSRRVTAAVMEAEMRLG
jgi:hypothetical protein